MSEQGHVSIDAAVVDAFEEQFSNAELQTLATSVGNIRANIIDVFNDVPVMDILKTQGMDFQEVFGQLEKIIPGYIVLLRSSVDEFGDETYFDSEQVKAVMDIHDVDQEGYRPKLLLDDGTRVFALLQVAAWKVGLNDDNVGLWYGIVEIFLRHYARERTDTH